MKLLMITGALLGFSVALALGVSLDQNWSSIFWRASVSACVTGLLLRWWGSVWIRSLRLAVIEHLNQPPEPKPSPVSTQTRS